MLKKLKNSASKLKEESFEEIRETKEVTKLLWAAKRRKLTGEEKERIKDQSMDIVRLLFLTALFVIPGSGVLIILLVKGGKRVGVRFLPSSFSKDTKTTQMIQETFEKILKFEQEAGESFTDYFMHDNVNDNAWATWLQEKGFTENAKVIFDEIADGNNCIDQDVLYEIYDENPDKEWSNEEHEKNVMLWAEFLSSKPEYLEEVNDFFKDNS